MTSELGKEMEEKIMNKEEILEASRSENKNKDYAEIEVENKAVKLASLCTLILATVYFCLEIFIKGETNYGWYSIIALYSAIVYGYKGIKSKKKICVVNSVLWGILAIAFICLYVREMYFTSTIL